jgi:uncharacterized protein YecE (DUF72 family)
MSSSDQFDLFGEPIPVDGAGNGATERRVKTESTKVAPAANDALASIGKALPANVFLGTSSWSYPGWAGLVYDATYPETTLSRHGLSAYARHPLLSTVSIDRTFYAPISEAEFRTYAKQVDVAKPDFRFLVKAPMLFTGPRLRSDDGQWRDNPAFLDAGLATTQFVLPATQGLAEKCGPLVFQFPPLGPRFTKSPTRFADALAEFLLALPKLSGNAYYAVEVRDPELLTDDYLAALCAGGATHCIAIHSRMPSAAEQSRFWRESGKLPLTIRWSLHSGFKYEEAKARYAPFNALIDEDPEGHLQVAELSREACHMGLAAFVIANNKAEGSAPLTIKKLSELIVERDRIVTNDR